jgi:TetR/AcrR family transcriptional regulator
MSADRSPVPAQRSRPGRRARKLRDAGATREALLRAGADLFAERGYEGVRVWAIAERAGVNKAMISYHFGGKRQLYLAIVKATFSEIVSRAERLAASTRPAPEVLREVIGVMAEVGTRRHVFGMMLREVLAGGRQLDREVVDKPVRVLAAVRAILERGVREGAFRPVDPLLTHLSLVGSLAFFFATGAFRERVLSDRRLGIKPPDADAYVRHIQDLISHGLAAEGVGASTPARAGRVSTPARRRRGQRTRRAP